MDKASKGKLYRLKKKLRKENLVKLKNADAMDIDIAMKHLPVSSENVKVGSETKSVKKLKHIYSGADTLLEEWFFKNQFGFACDVCDRLWFKNDLSKISKNHSKVLKNCFNNETFTDFLVCGTCKKSLSKSKIPNLAKSNGFNYPKLLCDLPNLNCIERRLISPRIYFTHIRRIRYDSNSQKVTGQIINIPIEIDEMVKNLPRNLDDDYAINVHLKKNLLHKSTYLQGQVKKSTLKLWLKYLIKTPLYKDNNISINEQFFLDISSNKEHNENSANFEIESMDQTSTETDYLLAHQQTLLWNEERILCLAPGQNKRPLSILMDNNAEELSFPDIYLGQPRTFKSDVKVSWFMMATSEIRRRDRRGASQEHIFYMALKLLRLRISQELHGCYKIFWNNI